MYGKIFTSIYDGTLAEDWRALITFQQLIVLCDADGVVDMTPTAISRRTGIPIEHIKAGLEILETPDHFRLRVIKITDSKRKLINTPEYSLDETGERLPEHIWSEIRKVVFSRDNYTCAYCGKYGGDLECDHICPLSLGGSNELENLTTACKPCNRSKGGKTIAEWGGLQ